MYVLEVHFGSFGGTYLAVVEFLQMFVFLYICSYIFRFSFSIGLQRQFKYGMYKNLRDLIKEGQLRLCCAVWHNQVVKHKQRQRQLKKGHQGRLPQRLHNRSGAIASGSGVPSRSRYTTPMLLKSIEHFKTY